MEDKKDILESLAGVTQPKQTDDIIDNAVTQSAQYYCDALTDENINDVLGDCDTHLITLVGFPKSGNQHLWLLCIIKLCLQEKLMDTSLLILILI